MRERGVLPVPMTVTGPGVSWEEELTVESQLPVWLGIVSHCQVQVITIPLLGRKTLGLKEQDSHSGSNALST